jgi:hypothetical protein
VGGVGGAGRPGKPGGVGGVGGVGGAGRPGNRPGQGNRPGGGNGNNINNGNINTGDINVDNGWGDGWGGYNDYPWGVGAGFVAGAWTAAAIGASYYSLPPGCPPYGWGGSSYYYCHGNYYQPQYEGDTVVYVTVPDPSNGQQAPPPDPYAGQ